MTMKTRAEEMANWFEAATRDNGDAFTKTRDGAPEWVRDVIHAAHGVHDLMPDDWTYGITRAAVDWISDADDDADMEDGASDFAESEVEVYTSQLLDWLAGPLHRIELADEALEDGAEGIAHAARQAQAEEARGIFAAVVEALAGLDDEDDEDDEGAAA